MTNEQEGDNRYWDHRQQPRDKKSYDNDKEKKPRGLVPSSSIKEVGHFGQPREGGVDVFTRRS